MNEHGSRDSGGAIDRSDRAITKHNVVIVIHDLDILGRARPYADISYLVALWRWISVLLKGDAQGQHLLPSRLPRPSSVYTDILSAVILPYAYFCAGTRRNRELDRLLG